MCVPRLAPQTQFTQWLSLARDTAAENFISAASGSAVSAGHDVICSHPPQWLSVDWWVSRRTHSQAQTQHIRGKENKANLHISSPQPRTWGFRLLNTAFPAQLPLWTLRSDYSARKEMLQSSSCLAPNFLAKTSAHYYPNLGNCSSLPLIIKRCFSASSNSNTTSPPRGRSSV